MPWQNSLDGLSVVQLRSSWAVMSVQVWQTPTEVTMGKVQSPVGQVKSDVRPAPRTLEVAPQSRERGVARIRPWSKPRTGV